MRDQVTTLAVEKLADLVKGPDWPRVTQLAREHWYEVAKQKIVRALTPDIPKYLQLERDDRLHIVILRSAGEIAGYSVHFLAKGHPHYKNLCVAEDDLHYVVPSLRGTRAHEKMRRFALRTLRERGVMIATARLKVDGRGHSTLLRMGYQPEDMVYTLNLTEWKHSPEE